MVAKTIVRPKLILPPPVPLHEREPTALMIDLIIQALRLNDGPINDIAFELLLRCGENPVRRLALEAADKKNRPGHRVRLLRAIGRIGVVSDTSSYMDLFFLTSDKNHAVRAAGAELIESLRVRRSEAMVDM